MFVAVTSEIVKSRRSRVAVLLSVRPTGDINCVLFVCVCSEHVKFNGEYSSDVKSSRTSWPRGQNFVLGLGLEDLSSVNITGAFTS